MKKHLHLYLSLALIIFCANNIFAQKISVNASVTVQQLIEDNLIDGCVEVSNITSTVNGNSTGFASYAEFNRGSSSFPFENGIVLSTGNAESAGNTDISTTLDEGSTAWGTDPDLETALGITESYNATSIEFDFVSISNQVQFNYLLASEEYGTVDLCQISDGFAFLIREAGSSDPYQNIAIIPGTSIPVSTNTVHEEIVGVCAAQNEDFFDGYNIGDTNYDGRTEVFTASTTITPYVQYHIKLVIADQLDNRFDSSVFIEGDSFKVLDLGEDISTCASSVPLDADLGNPNSIYQWYFNNNPIPAPNGTQSSYSAIQSGTYKVEITNPLGSSDCIEEDEIVVDIQNEIILTPITPYELCDDLSGDQTETFDLSTKNTEVSSVVPSSFINYDFTYHLTEAEARSNSNSINTPINNSTNPLTIFVRINDLDAGCIAYTSFDLVVNTIPNITSPSNLSICDSDEDPTDGITSIDLTEKNDEITSGQTDLVVTYHYNNLDANTGNNIIPVPYTNTNTPTETVFVRIQNTITGCYNTTSLTVDLTNGPVINRELVPLDGCDSDLDGFDEFDLTQAIDDVLDGLTNATVTFHQTPGDARTGSNAIANETNYENITPEVQTVFVRVEDNATGCASIAPLEIHTNLLLTGTNTGDFALCDDESNDGIVSFNLNIIETFIADDLADDRPDFEVTFYESQDNFDNNIPIDKNVLFVADQPSTPLIISITDGNCTEISEITLRIDPVLIFTLSPQYYCDDDDDGIVSIDLTSFDDIITSGNTDFRVFYFPTEADANANTNQLPPFYMNSSPSEDIFARIENESTGCFTVNPFEIIINTAPSITEPTPWLICDDNDDGITNLNLEDKISEIVTSTSGLDISFYTNLNDANAKNNAILTPQNYDTSTQNIYVRVENDDSFRCYDIATIQIIVNTLPIFPSIEDFKICEDDGDNTEAFLFSTKDNEILNGQTGKEVLYFEDPAFTIPIDKNTPYLNTSSPQTIYIRVQNITDPNCFGTNSFLIEVGTNPDYIAPSPFLICDDSSNDGIGDFDLNEKINQISQGSSTALNINFFTSEADAIANTSPISTNFTNTVNPQTLYARIENPGSSCVVIEDFGINVVPAPDVSDALPFSLCDDNTDGFVEFNLDNAQYQIFDRIQTGIVINYFENLADVDDDALAISNPNNYNSDTKTVYIKVNNTFTTCYTIIPLDLQVTPLPVINFNGTHPICDNDTDTFDLTTMDTILVSDTNVVDINYYNSQNDAINNNNPLSDIFNYTSNSHTIFTRVQNITTGCISYSSFTLLINPTPIATTPNNLEDCDDDFDGVLQFDLSVTAGEIIGIQNPSDFTVTYYNNLSDAETKTTPLNNLYEATDGEIIYARLENNNTGCFNTTQFTTIVLPKPIIPIDDVIFLCLNDLPLTIDADTGNTGDTYLWSTTVNSIANGSTSSQIDIYPNNLGDYSVTVTSQDGCSSIKNFTVQQSESAEIEVIPTVHFADPNSITVNIKSTNIGDYVYILDDGEPQTSNIFNNVAIGEHTVIVRDLNGCEDVEQTVTVFDVPKFVTPNNDNHFDTWHITGVNQLVGTVVYIYDRHGKLLKTLPHSSPGWDGTFNGYNMPADDYWFDANIIKDGSEIRLRGHFALVR